MSDLTKKLIEMRERNNARFKALKEKLEKENKHFLTRKWKSSDEFFKEKRMY